MVEHKRGPAPDTERFWRHGWQVVRKVFAADEIQDIRARVLSSLAEREAGAPACDLLGDARLRELVHDRRLVDLARALLGGDPVYFGDASYAVVGRGYDEMRDATGYHRDNTDRSDLAAPDWQGRYSLIRIGVYLQDHSRHAGGLLVRDGSHDRIVRGWGSYLKDRYLNTAIGDLGVWSMRTQHAGVGRGWRFWPAMGIPPVLNERVPTFLQLPRWDVERAAVWISYALDDHHLARHMKYLYGRSERLQMWQHSVYEPAVIDDCRAVGLGVIDAPARMREMLASGVEVGMHPKHYQIPY